MNVVQLTDRIRLLEFEDMKGLFGVNSIVGVIDDGDAIYLIDSGLGPEHIQQVVDEATKPVHLILTHAHWDHIWGAEAIPGNIYAHESAKDEFSQKDLKKFKRYHRGVTELCYPTHTFKNELRVSNLQLLWTPGHSPDHIAVWDPIDQAMFVGDTLFVDYRDESLTELHQKSLQMISEYDFKYLIPGHVGVMGRKELDTAIYKLERNDTP